MSRKSDQVAAALKRAVQDVIARRLADPRLSGLITITEARVSPDGAQATFLVSVFPHDREKLVLQALEHSVEHIRHEAGNLIQIRRMPKFTFRLDESLKKQGETFAAIARAREEQGEDAPEQGGSPGPDHDATERS
ncbi:MAG: 30S ribosome-binding factor RbfA [Phycisphaerales bacterium]